MGQAVLLVAELSFRPMAGFNDVWFEIDFKDEQFEEAVIEYFGRMLGKRYAPISKAPRGTHCWAFQSLRISCTRPASKAGRIRVSLRVGWGSREVGDQVRRR